MNQWPEVRIGDLGDIFTGRTPSTERPSYFGGDFPFITPGDMHQGKYAHETARTLSQEGADLLHRIRLPAESVCVSCIGWQMGEVIMTTRPSFTNQQINTIVPNDEVESSFLFYSLLPRKQELLSLGAATGVRTPILNKSTFSDLKVKLPPLPVQRRIAGILSAYDELIENSQRRITLLEGMARALYREWFVHFRFPGHENHPRVATPLGEIPAGWEVKPIHEFGKVITGKTPSKANEDFYGNDVPFVKTPDMHGNMFILSTNEKLSSLGAQSQSNKTLPLGTICVSCIGTIGVVSLTTEDSQTNQQINSIVVANKATREFLFFRLQDAKRMLENLGANGATMGNVNKAKFEAMTILTPPIDLLLDYHRFVHPFFVEILGLMRQIQNLRQTRDLLLPRLLSGQVVLTKSEGQLATTNVIPFAHINQTTQSQKANDEFVEAVIIAQFTRELATIQFPLGRFRYNKFSYLAHRKSEDDVQSHYLKKAAGPYSPWAKHGGPEKIAIKNGYIKLVNGRKSFIPGENIGKIDAYITRYPIHTAIGWVVQKFRYYKNEDLELLTTVDFAALDLIREDLPITTGGIKHIIATNKEWAPKLDRAKFSEANITRALKELRAIFPSTYTSLE